MKIFNIGLSRCGGRSLAVALTNLGLAVKHDWLTCLTMIRHLENDELDKFRSIVEESNADVFIDGDFFVVWKKILLVYPDARFTMTYRGRDQWVNSNIINVLSSRLTGGNGYKEINTDELNLRYFRVWEQSIEMVSCGVPIVRIGLGLTDDSTTALGEMVGKQFPPGYQWPNEGSSEYKFDIMKRGYLKGKPIS